MDPLSAGIQTFKAGQNTLAYHIEPSKKPNAPLWVTQAIHWGPGRTVYVNTLTPLLAKYYTVLTLSPRGSDESSRPKDEDGNDDSSAMSVTHITEDIESLRKHLNIEAFHVLSGHSLAGISTLLYAALYPSRIKNLVPIGTGIFAAHDGTSVWNHYRDIRASQPEWKKAYGTWEAAKTNPPSTNEEFFPFLMKVLPSYLTNPSKDLAPLVDGFKGAEMQIWCYKSYLGTRASDEKLQKLFDLLKHVKARVLFVHGEHDMSCPIEAVRIAGRRLREEAGLEAELAVSEVGHFPWVEDREGFERGVFGFLGDE